MALGEKQRDINKVVDSKRGSYINLGKSGRVFIKEVILDWSSRLNRVLEIRKRMRNDEHLGGHIR